MSEAHERAEHLIHHNARRDWWTIALAALVIILAGWNGYLLHEASETARTAQENAVSLAEQVQAACEDADVIVSDRNICERADDVADQPAVPAAAPAPGPTGPTGPPPSFAEVMDAVRQVCGPPSSLCDGPPGEPGRPGQDASPVPGPTGAAGRDGVPGRDGEDGAPGPAGPPPTPEDIAAAVAAYCAERAECRGADSTVPGPSGPVGPVGPAGPSCADGWSPRTLFVQTRDDPEQPFTQRWQSVTVCTPLAATE